jgi:glycosyltransferase involved in cell wall biosynthesis
MKIEFIIPTYNRPYKLMTIISSIKAQSIDAWKIHVVADAMYEGYDEVKNIFINDPRIRFSELNGPHGDWGHTARNYGLQEATEEWVVMTGDDNYYVPVFCELFLQSIENEPSVNFVYCNMVHNWVNNDYIPVRSVPQINGIDIGNFMSKTENAKQLRLDVNEADADGRFVEEYLQKFPASILHIDKLLYVHN